MRFADVDMLRHVNNVNQQHYFDVGKNDYFAAVMQMAPGHWLEEGLIVVATDSSYMSQVRYNSSVVVYTKAEKLGTKSITLFQQIVDGDSGEVKSESRSVLVAFDFVRQVSIPLPQLWRDRIGVHEGF